MLFVFRHEAFCRALLHGWLDGSVGGCIVVALLTHASCIGLAAHNTHSVAFLALVEERCSQRPRPLAASALLLSTVVSLAVILSALPGHSNSSGLNKNITHFVSWYCAQISIG